VIVWLFGLAALAYDGRSPAALADFDPHHLTEPFRSALANRLLAPTARWDSVWYLQIAHSGYQSRATSAFFPLYPLLIHLGALVTGSDLVAAVLISLIALVVGLDLLHRLVSLELGEPAATVTVLLVALFPTSLFLSAVYSDSLFLTLAVAAIYAARRDCWARAGVLACLATLTRSNGFLIAVPLVLLAAGTRVGRPPYRWSRSLLWLSLIPAALVAYFGYQALIHNGTLAPFQTEALWERQFAGPFGAVPHAFALLPGDVHRLLTGQIRPAGSWDPLGWDAHDLIDLGFLAFAGAGLCLAWRRVPFAYSAYALVMLAESLSAPTPHEPLESFSRYLLAAFPVFMGWGAVLAERPRAGTAVLAASGGLLAVFSGLWAIWAWVA
jgi:Mannosyltransferase (PIG-V)